MLVSVGVKGRKRGKEKGDEEKVGYEKRKLFAHQGGDHRR
jgi:hypothetical protein